jgi:outer membrane protein, heavy metal efflux system
MKMILFHILKLSILLLILPTLQAQVYPKEYLLEALENNPGLQARAKAYEAALQQADIISTLPDPEITAGFFIPPMKRFMGNQRIDLGVMQMFPWFGTLSYQKSAAQKMAEASWQQFRQQRNELFLEITRMWLQIYRIQEQINIVEKNIQSLKNQEDIIYSRYQAGLQGSGMAPDIYRMEIQINNFENQRDKLQEEKLSIQKSFNLIIGREINFIVDLPNEVPNPVFSLADQAGEGFFMDNPELKMVQAEAEAAEIRQTISRLNTKPMMGLGVQYSYFSPGGSGQMDGGHMVMPMVAVTVPIFGKKNRAVQNQGTLLAESARMEENNQHINLQTQWSLRLAEIRNLERDLAFYQRQLEITEKTRDLVITGYSAGFEGFEELLRIQDQLLEIEWRLIEARVNLHIGLAEMEMLQAVKVFE